MMFFFFFTHHNLTQAQLEEEKSLVLFCFWEPKLQSNSCALKEKTCRKSLQSIRLNIKMMYKPEVRQYPGYPDLHGYP